MNSCNFVGRIVSDLELKRSKSGVTYLRFFLTIPGGRRKSVTGTSYSILNLAPCVAFEDTAIFIARHFRRDDYIAVVAEYQTDESIASNGAKKTLFRFIVRSADFHNTPQGKTDRCSFYSNSAFLRTVKR